MKKLTLLLLFVLNTSMLFAQKTDTVKKWVDGVMIKSTDNIVESISQIKDLSKFDTLLKYSGLADTIKIKGPVTIFAPDNKALTSSTGIFYDSLCTPAHKWQLANVLKCYIVQGRFTSVDILKLIRKGNGHTELMTLAGPITARIDTNRNIVLMDMNHEESVISKFDIRQKDGILDIVTAILFPLKQPG